MIYQKLGKNAIQHRFRIRLTERYRMGLYTALDIWQVYGINRSLLHKWNCRYYRRNILYYQTPRSMNPKKKSDKARIAELERQIKELKAAYQDEKLAKELYQKMIRIAEQMFDIKIEKKPG